MREPHIRCTELWEVRPDGKRFLKNEIKGGDRFETVKLSADEKSRQHSAEVQLKIARSLKDGWVQNGPYGGIYKYEIVQKWSTGDVVLN